MVDGPDSDRLHADIASLRGRGRRLVCLPRGCPLQSDHRGRRAAGQHRQRGRRRSGAVQRTRAAALFSARWHPPCAGGVSNQATSIFGSVGGRKRADGAPRPAPCAGTGVCRGLGPADVGRAAGGGRVRPVFVGAPAGAAQPAVAVDGVRVVGTARRGLLSVDAGAACTLVRAVQPAHGVAHCHRDCHGLQPGGGPASALRWASFWSDGRVGHSADVDSGCWRARHGAVDWR